MTIEQMLSQLEQQKATIERAIAALKELSQTGMQSGAAATVNLAVTKRRGRPPKNAQLSSETGEPSVPSSKKSAGRSPSKGARTRPVYGDDFKRDVVSAVRNGMSIGEAAKKYKTTWFSVREWVNSRRFEPLGGVKKSAQASGASAAGKKAPATSKGAAKKATRKSASSRSTKKKATAKSAAQAEGSSQTDKS